MCVDFQCDIVDFNVVVYFHLSARPSGGNFFDAVHLAVLNKVRQVYKNSQELLILVKFDHRALGVGIDMLRQLVPAVILVFFKLISVTSSQSCIRNEVKAAIEELENRSPPGGSLQSIQCANIANTQIQELNNTMQQGFQEIREELQEMKSLFSTILSLHYDRGFSPSNPAHSCKEIYDRNTSSPSGYYWLQSSSEKLTRVYCDMERTCGGVQGGWMKVASIDMTDPTNSCPSGLKTLTSPKRLCAMNINGAGCSSAYLDVQGVEYSSVCGKIIGYQQKTSDAFWSYYKNRALTIDQNYVDGISLTHGSPRKHIWTFAAALHEVTSIYPTNLCPCTNIHNHVTIPIPPYVGNDYFCDTASSQRYEGRFYPNDPLWDGQGCGHLNTCCSFNNPPWFMKQLPASTHDNIEMRLCADEGRSNEDIVFETLDIYVQ